MADSSIRRATVGDAETLSELGASTFIETFGHLYPADDLEDFIEESYAPETFAAFLALPGHALWLAEKDGRAVGFAQAGPCALPHPEATPECGELKRLYVRKDAQNGGHGAALMATALDWLQSPGRRLWIGVWSRNYGAQRFYARYGFSKVGEYQFPVGETLDEEFILSRP